MVEVQVAQPLLTLDDLNRYTTPNAFFGAIRNSTLGAVLSLLENNGVDTQNLIFAGDAKSNLVNFTDAQTIFNALKLNTVATETSATETLPVPAATEPLAPVPPTGSTAASTAVMPTAREDPTPANIESPTESVRDLSQLSRLEFDKTVQDLGINTTTPEAIFNEFGAKIYQIRPEATYNDADDTELNLSEYLSQNSDAFFPVSSEKQAQALEIVYAALKAVDLNIEPPKVTAPESPASMNQFGTSITYPQCLELTQNGSIPMSSDWSRRIVGNLLDSQYRGGPGGKCAAAVNDALIFSMKDLHGYLGLPVPPDSEVDLYRLSGNTPLAIDYGRYGMTSPPYTQAFARVIISESDIAAMGTNNRGTNLDLLAATFPEGTAIFIPNGSDPSNGRAGHASIHIGNGNYTADKSYPGALPGIGTAFPYTALPDAEHIYAYVPLSPNMINL